MTEHSTRLLEGVLRLPERERGEVAMRLIASLDGVGEADAEGVEAAWSGELERRGERVTGGEGEAEPWEVVLERAEHKLIGYGGE